MAEHRIAYGRLMACDCESPPRCCALLCQELGLSSLLFFRPTERANEQLIDYLPQGFKLLHGAAAGKGRGSSSTFADAGPAKKRIKVARAVEEEAEEEEEEEEAATASSEPEARPSRRVS